MRTRRSGESALLLLDVIDILRRLRVPYAIIGAMAASYYGVVRGSLDADALLSLTTQSLKDLERQFSQAGLQTELRPGSPEDPVRGLLAIRDTYGNRVDLLGGIRGVGSEAFGRTVPGKFSGISVRFISLEDFIAMKLGAGSPLDIEDARRAIAVSRKRLRLPLLRRLTSRFGKSALSQLDTLLG